MTQPLLTHPATNPDGTCSDLNCPCQQWSKQPNATRTGLDLYHHEEALRRRQRERDLTHDPGAAQAEYELSEEEAALVIGAIPLQALPTTNDDDTISDCEPETPKINYSEYMRTFKYPPPQPPETIKVVIRAATSDDWIGVAYQKDYTGDPSTIHEYCLAERESPALRNTRSIAHHAEMVEEQKRSEHRDDCGVWTWPGAPCDCAEQKIANDAAQRAKRQVPSSLFSPCARGDHDECAWVILDDGKGGYGFKRYVELCSCPHHLPHPDVEAVANDTAQHPAPPSTFEHAWAELSESDRRVTERAVAEKMYFAGRRDREGELLATINEELRARVERVVTEEGKET